MSSSTLTSGRNLPEVRCERLNKSSSEPLPPSHQGLREGSIIRLLGTSQPVPRPRSMLELVSEGDRRSIVTSSLRLEFRWSEDRWIHAIEPIPSSRPIVRTIEGDLDSDDPTRVVSPAYQQLEFQERDAGLQALLVGQSGPHHFSAVFTVEESRGVSNISVDIADRCRSPVESLTCTYWVDVVSGDLLAADPSLIQWRLGSGQLDFLATQPGSAQLSEAGRRATRVQANASLVRGSNTHRCLYQWRWRPITAPLAGLADGLA